MGGETRSAAGGFCPMRRSERWAWRLESCRNMFPDLATRLPCVARSRQKYLHVDMFLKVGVPATHMLGLKLDSSLSGDQNRL